MFELKDEDLLMRLKQFEDSFVERKSCGDSRDWLKTVVGFANSVPFESFGLLFIGVRNDGTVEETVDLDSLQKTLNRKLADAYPIIPRFTKVLREDQKQFLAVVVPGSRERPHFSGPGYIREGSETKGASSEQFDQLIAQRNEKAYLILKWKDKLVTVRRMNIEKTRVVGNVAGTFEAIVHDCNSFFVTLAHSGGKETVPIRRLDLGYHDNANQLMIDIYPI